MRSTLLERGRSTITTAIVLSQAVMSFTVHHCCTHCYLPCTARVLYLDASTAECYMLGGYSNLLMPDYGKIENGCLGSTSISSNIMRRKITNPHIASALPTSSPWVAVVTSSRSRCEVPEIDFHRCQMYRTNRSPRGAAV